MSGGRSGARGAQAWMLGRVEDLEGSLYEPEFDHWQR